MNRKRWIRILKMCSGITALALLIFLGTASAATLCVDKTGANGCYTTIQLAVNNASAGDVINVEPGLYLEGSSLSVQKSVTIVSVAGAEKTKIEGSSTGVSVGTNSTVYIRGFTISGATQGVYMNAGTLTLDNNIIVGIGSHGILCSAPSNYMYYVCDIRNNTILSSGGEGIYSDECGYYCSPTIKLYNNIILDTVNLNSDSETCIYNTITGAILNTSCSNTQTQDPLFIPGSYCAVQSGSPTIDAGEPSPTNTDPDGTRINQGPCGGRYAAAFWPYPSGGPVITNLTVTPASVPQGGTITIQATGEVR